MQKLLFVLLLTTVLFSCKNQTVSSIEVKDISLTSDGPYYEGPNSFQATLVNTLKKNNINSENVDKIVLTSATIILPDSLEDGLLQNLSLQLVSNSSEMRKVAYVNPMPTGKKEIQLATSQEQDGIHKIFLKEEFITLLDANFSKDLESNLAFKANLTFEITTH
jgi:hypothetical protein